MDELELVAKGLSDKAEELCKEAAKDGAVTVAAEAEAAASAERLGPDASPDNQEASSEQIQGVV